jgi:hypothetical protein
MRMEGVPGVAWGRFTGIVLFMPYWCLYLREIRRKLARQ